MKSRKENARKRTIVFISQWFPPEHAPMGHMIYELAQRFRDHGWDVTIITGFPNHPTGIVFSGYKKKILQQENIEGIAFGAFFFLPAVTEVS